MLGGFRGVGQRACGGNDGRQGRGSLLIFRRGAVPDLQCEACEVDVFVGLIIVQGARVLGVKVAQLVGSVFAEERLVGADDFLVFLEAAKQALAQPDDAVHSLGREERIDGDGVVPLADAVHAAGTLNQPDDRPGEVEVHDQVGVLKVLAFGEHVGGNQHAQFGLAVAQSTVGGWAETPGKCHRA